MRKIIPLILLLLPQAAFADDLQPPNNSRRWPMSTVNCVNIDFDPTDAQPPSQDCTQVWFNDSEKCYYDHTMVLINGLWRTYARTLVRFEFGQDLRCTPDTHPVPPPAHARRLAPRLGG